MAEENGGFLLFFLSMKNLADEGYTLDEIRKYVKVGMHSVSLDWNNLTAYEAIDYPVKVCTREDF